MPSRPPSRAKATAAVALSLALCGAPMFAAEGSPEPVPAQAMPTLAPRRSPRPSAPPQEAKLAPAAHAAEVAARIPFVKHALYEVHLAASMLKDEPLRSAVESVLEAPWLPPEAYVRAHPAEAEEKLRAAGLLGAGEHVTIPPLGAGTFDGAPGGPCETGHHGYPGGLAVHEWADLSHARALAGVYQDVYGVSLDLEWLSAAALWHDAMKAGTLPWNDAGDCPHAEAQLAGTQLHHTLGIATAILRHLPKPLILIIASAHAPPTREHLHELCGFLRAAGILAVGREDAVPCPSLDEGAPRPPIEAFVTNSADSDYALTGAAWSWYASQTPGGWERFAALEADGSDVAAFQRAGPRLRE